MAKAVDPLRNGRHLIKFVMWKMATCDYIYDTL